jgi:hypothetical protein
MSNVIASEVLVAGLRAEFADTYAKLKRESDARLSLVMDLNIGSTRRYEPYGYFLASPHAAYWKRGTSIPTKGFASVGFQIYNLNWGRRVPWHKDDIDDDQTGTLMDNARATGRSFALLPERFFFDLMQGTTQTLPYVPLAPDGVPMFSAVDGAGLDRFGATGGNVIAGGGVADPGVIRANYYAAISRAKLFQDGEGQPLHDDQAVDGEWVVIYGAHNTEVFEEAFLQKRVGELTAGTDGVATPTNIVHDASRRVRLWGTQRITSDDWFAFMVNAPKKPTFLQTRAALEERFATMDNSDHARNVDEEYIQWKWRGNGGIALPYAAFQIDNA